MHESEDINDGSLLEEIIRSYAVKRIYETFHISLLEFLELPVDIVQMLFSIAEEEDSKKASELSKLEASMK